MNYPTHFVDRRQKREPSPKDDNYNLSYMHQQRPQAAMNNTQIYKPLSSVAKNKPITREEKVGSPPKGFKSSTYTLTTTPFADRAFLVISYLESSIVI